MKRDDLSTYREKRDFERTAEPRGEVRASNQKKLSYVIQRHHATRLHFDFRLELDGVLKSWAVPKGPSLAPSEKRLAVEVEDHPLDYGGFEGSIPHGEYGGGHVLLWDKGTWAPVGDPHEGLARGRLELILHGERLHGAFMLVRLRGKAGEKKHDWLLFKKTDADARRGAAAEVAATAAVPPLARFVPQLATLERELPKSEGWAFELKLDGYRALAAVGGGKTRLLSRNQKDWTARFPTVVEALSALSPRAMENAVFDGEICSVDAQGRTRFQDLQGALSAGTTDRLVYFIFDLLFVDGFDVRDRPLSVRKAILESILDGVKPPLAYVAHFEGAMEAKKVFAQACRRELEGLVAKRLDEPYRAGRGRGWLKVKCTNEQELVIVGYTKPRGSRAGLGALLLGVNEGGGLRYVGKVGTGFSQQVLATLSKRLAALVVPEPGVSGAPRMKDVHWVKPELVGQVSFSEKTRDGLLRHPSFLGLREDKAAEDVVLEEALEKRRDGKERVAGVAISHPDRVVDGSSGATKLELARYIEAVGRLMLPYARCRPLALVRCPDSISGTCFFQKKKYPGMPASIHASKVSGKDVVAVEDGAGLIALVQFGVVEIHGWGARLPSADKPDWMVIDLDPDEDLDFARVADAALEVRELFRSIGLESFVKTTGGKGLHVVAPIVPTFGWSEVKALAQAIATTLEARDRERFTSIVSKRRRTGRIFVDYLRNGEGATAILPYSPRCREGLPVAVPIGWEEVHRVHPRELTMKTVAAMLARRKKDPWAEFFETNQPLPSALGELARRPPRVRGG